MGRLTDKLAAAAAVAPRQAAKIEARADRIIAYEAAIEEETDAAFSPHEALIAEAEKGLQDVRGALATMTNNPPLERSSDSPASPVAVPGPKPVPLVNTFRAEAEQQIAAGHKL